MKENIYSYMTEKQVELVSFALDFLKSNLDHDIVASLTGQEEPDENEGEEDQSPVDIQEGYDKDILGMEKAIEDAKDCFEVIIQKIVSRDK